MNDHRRLRIPPLDSRERSHFHRAVRSLEAVPLGGSPSAVFDALRALAPVTGGLIGVMGSEMDGNAVSHVVGLPNDVLDGWARTPLEHLHRMMGPLVVASPGEVISDRMALQGRFREQVDLLRVLEAANMGEAAGYKIASRSLGSGKEEHHFLTIALERGELFTPRRRQLLGLLQPDIWAALSRMAVPLTASQPLAAQLIAQGRIGYLGVSMNGTIVEWNQRAHDLIAGYLKLAEITSGPGFLQRFVERALRETASCRTWSIFRRDVPRAVEISSCPISKVVHLIGEDLTLMMIREIETGRLVLPSQAKSTPSARRQRRAERRAASLAPPLAKPTPRQMQVASLLTTTERTYEEMARDLGIAVGTVRKHVEGVYRAFGVTSRAALTLKLR